MKKGFTLIELLAVIVILAIIALIATPIILNIINDAREKANERSVELYASAVRNAMAAYQLTGTSAPTSFEDLDIEYDRNVECETEELYSDGSFYIADCTVNGNVVNYAYGEKQEKPYVQVYKPQYYYFGYDWEGYVGETVGPANPSSVPPTGEIRYLGYDVTDGVVSAAYICFTRNENEYCLKGYDTETFATNTDIIKDAFADVLDTKCSFTTGESRCYDSSDFSSVDCFAGGSVILWDTNQHPCSVSSGGFFRCSNSHSGGEN